MGFYPANGGADECDEDGAKGRTDWLLEPVEECFFHYFLIRVRIAPNSVAKLAMNPTYWAISPVALLTMKASTAFTTAIRLSSLERVASLATVIAVDKATGTAERTNLPNGL